MRQIKNALSNEVWINDKNKIEKHYSSDEFKKYYGNQEVKFLELLNREYTLEGNILTIDQIEHEEFDDDNMSNEDIVNVASALKDLHKLDVSDLKMSAFEEVYNEFFSEYEKTLEEFPIDGTEYLLAEEALDILHEGKQVALHNDVVQGNLLKTKDKITLIDFEYSGKGNQLFDIASFLTEREMTEEQRTLFIEQFDDVDINKLNIVCKFLQIFWTRWALYKFDLTNKEIYQEIADWKFKEYLKIK